MKPPTFYCWKKTFPPVFRQEGLIDFARRPGLPACEYFASEKAPC